jgi:hypothetical protein
MPVSNDHTNHDPALIAAHAADDLSGAEIILANRLLASCEECARLQVDLQAIAAATHALPAMAAAPRDYRLTAERAAGLRRGSLVRRLLRPFAGPSTAIRSTATAFSTVGALALAVVLLLPVLGSPASMSAPERDASVVAGPSAGAQGVPVPGDAGAVPTSGGPRENFDATAAPGEQPAAQVDGKNGEDGATNAPYAPTATSTPGTDAAPSPSAGGAGPNPATFALIASSVLLAVGLALFALRGLARRFA